VQRRRVEIDVDALVITEGKAGYIGARGISVDDVFEVLAHAPRFFVRLDPESGEEEYSMLGLTSGGRFLLVAIEKSEEEGVWRLISAYPLNARRGQRLYEGS